MKKNKCKNKEPKNSLSWEIHHFALMNTHTHIHARHTEFCSLNNNFTSLFLKNVLLYIEWEPPAVNERSKPHSFKLIE